MARDISVSIAVQGEREFAQALKNAQSAVRVLSSELKASEAAFDDNSDAQAYYANRSRLISAQIEQQKTILSSLEQAIREASEEFGDASAKTDKWRIELNKTHGEIAKLERALRETQQEAEELGRDGERVGRQLRDGIGDAAKQTADDVERLSQQINQELSSIGKGVDISVALDLGNAVKGAVTGAMGAINDLVEGTEEYRRSMSFIETSALVDGLDLDALKNLAFQTAAVTGDLENAMEGMQNLSATGFDMKELAEAIELVTGAVIKFPTMDFSSISEGILETIQTGNATGSFLELLEKLGTGEEKIKALNEALSSTTNLEVRQQSVLGYLNEQGLEDYVQTWRELYPEMQKAEESQIRLLEAQAELAKSFTPLSTAGTNAMAGLIEGLTRMVQALNESRQVAEAESSAISQAVNEAVSESGMQEAVLDLNDQIIKAYEEGNSQLAKELEAEQAATVQKIGELREEVVKELEKPIETPVVDTEEANYFSEVNSKVEQARKNLPGWDAVWTGVDAGAAAAADTAIDRINTGLTEGAPAVEETSKTIGRNMTTSLANGIVEGAPDAISAASSLWSSVNAELSRQIVIPKPAFEAGSYNGTGKTTASSYAAGGQNNTVTVITQIDGDTVAESTAGGVSSRQAQQAQRASTYGR